MCASARRRLFYLLLLLSILFETSAFQNGVPPTAPSAITAMAAEALFAYWERKLPDGAASQRRAAAAAACCRAIPHYRSRSAPVVLHLRAASLSRPRRPNELWWRLWLPAGTQTLATLWQVWRRQRQRRSELIGEKLPTRSPASFLFK